MAGECWRGRGGGGTAKEREDTDVHSVSKILLKLKQAAAMLVG